MKISEGCPQYFRSVPNEKISEGCPQYFQSMSNENIEGLSIVFSECVQ